MTEIVEKLHHTAETTPPNLHPEVLQAGVVVHDESPTIAPSVQEHGIEHVGSTLAPQPAQSIDITHLESKPKHPDSAISNSRVVNFRAEEMKTHHPTHSKGILHTLNPFKRKRPEVIYAT